MKARYNRFFFYCYYTLIYFLGLVGKIGMKPGPTEAPFLIWAFVLSRVTPMELMSLEEQALCPSHWRPKHP